MAWAEHPAGSAQCAYFLTSHFAPTPVDSPSITRAERRRADRLQAPLRIASGTAVVRPPYPRAADSSDRWRDPIASPAKAAQCGHAYSAHEHAFRARNIPAKNAHLITNRRGRRQLHGATKHPPATFQFVKNRQESPCTLFIHVKSRPQASPLILAEPAGS
jgi:hypothetical protein